MNNQEATEELYNLFKESVLDKKPQLNNIDPHIIQLMFGLFV